MSVILPMQPWHLLSVMMNARTEDLFDIDLEDRQKWACRRALEPGIAFTVLGTDGMPVSCFGFVDGEAGVCSAWLIATPDWCRYVKSMAKAFRIIVRDGGYRRIQAMVKPQRPGADRLLTWLGFSLDGPLPKMGSDGSSMNLYSYT